GGAVAREEASSIQPKVTITVSTARGRGVHLPFTELILARIARYRPFRDPRRDRRADGVSSGQFDSPFAPGREAEGHQPGRWLLEDVLHRHSACGDPMPADRLSQTDRQAFDSVPQR